ncbi:hypothetical protein P3S67_010443 [Capsicum chacoense]
MAGNTSRIMSEDKLHALRRWRGRSINCVKSSAELLAEAVKPLKLLNMDTSIFTPAAIISLFLFVKQYIRHTRVFLSLSDPTMMKETALAAARAGVYDLSMPHGDAGWTLSPEDVLKISTWMKSPEGDSHMRVIYRKRKLKKKVQKLEEMVDSDIPDPVLLTQLHEYKAELKQRTCHFDKKIDSNKI